MFVDDLLEDAASDAVSVECAAAGDEVEFGAVESVDDELIAGPVRRGEGFVELGR